MSVTASAPGKVILFGEHFVVYGNPAIVSSIDLRARVTASSSREEGVTLEGWPQENPAVRSASYILEKLRWKGGISLKTSSEIPQSVGLGSSAAIAVASAAAALKLCSDKLDLKLVLEAAHEGEKIIHYTPSGIDTSIAAFGGAGTYTRSEGYRELDFRLEEILIVNTGRQRRTGDLVRRVKEFREKDPKRFEELLEESKRIVEESVDHLKAHEVEPLGKLMIRNQELLRAIGVSAPEIERAVDACMSAGAYGAKLTGAGGGGCVIAVADYDKLDLLAEKLGKYFQVFRARLRVEGVRIEP
ncbi:MAG: mevalonate kinase [Thaumarchaeota archaeon]|nr:MAG: mevalonate kinase [Nitrososphaerota archaeon]HDD43227.1 mevalonate kinase [Nitrososphaeria archaeon]